MNIFVLSNNPAEAAQWAVDRHCGKMILESAQMFANCFSDEQLADVNCPRTQTGNIRKHSYFNHPCSKWLRESKSNMWWLIFYAGHLNTEFKARNSIRANNMGYMAKDHFSMGFIDWCQDNIKISNVPDGPCTPFAQAMPDEYKNPDAVVAYRNYYKFGKPHLHKWTRNKPDWI